MVLIRKLRKATGTRTISNKINTMILMGLE